MRQACTLRGTQARLGADTFACCILGQSWLPNGFGKAFAKRWMPHAIEFSQGFERISFQSAISEVGVFVAILFVVYSYLMK